MHLIYGLIQEAFLAALFLISLSIHRYSRPTTNNSISIARIHHTHPMNGSSFVKPNAPAGLHRPEAAALQSRTQSLSE